MNRKVLIPTKKSLHQLIVRNVHSGIECFHVFGIDKLLQQKSNQDIVSNFLQDKLLKLLIACYHASN